MSCFKQDQQDHIVRIKLLESEVCSLQAERDKVKNNARDLNAARVFMIKEKVRVEEEAKEKFMKVEKELI